MAKMYAKPAKSSDPKYEKLWDIFREYVLLTSSVINSLVDSICEIMRHEPHPVYSAILMDLRDLAVSSNRLLDALFNSKYVTATTYPPKNQNAGTTFVLGTYSRFMSGYGVEMEPLFGHCAGVEVKREFDRFHNDGRVVPIVRDFSSPIWDVAKDEPIRDLAPVKDVAALVGMTPEEFLGEFGAPTGAFISHNLAVVPLSGLPADIQELFHERGNLK